MAPTRASAAYRTIDDELGDSATGLKPVYSPQSAWKQGNPCDCNLSSQEAFQGTWHIGTLAPGDAIPPSVTINFTGPQVYVYNTLADARVVLGKDAMTNPNVSLTFDMDGVYAGKFTAPKFLGVLYQTQVFAREELSDAPHTLKISLLPPNDPQLWSIIIFDYVQYLTTHDHPPSTSSSHSSPPSVTSDENISPPSSSSARDDAPSDSPPPTPNTARPTGAIVGGAVGGVVAVVLAGTALFICRRKIQSRRRPITLTPLPFTADAVHYQSSRGEKDQNYPDGAPLSVAPGADPERIARAARGDVGSTTPAPSSDTSRQQRRLDGVPSRNPSVAYLPRTAVVDEARVRALEEQMTRMQALIEAPPGYESLSGRE